MKSGAPPRAGYLVSAQTPFEHFTLKRLLMPTVDAVFILVEAWEARIGSAWVFSTVKQSDRHSERARLRDQAKLDLFEKRDCKIRM